MFKHTGKNHLPKETSRDAEIDEAKKAINLVLPGLAELTPLRVNVDTLIHEYLIKQGLSGLPFDAAMLDRVMTKIREGFPGKMLYGGWLEDRKQLFSGAYPNTENRYLHLGVDVWTAAGEPVFCPAGKVMHVVTSDDPEIGWGTRVDLLIPEARLVLLIGHLNPQTTVHKGQVLTSDANQIGTVGSFEVNGHVPSHIHLQFVRLPVYESIPADKLDGYGDPREIYLLKQQYPEPLKLLASLCAR